MSEQKSKSTRTRNWSIIVYPGENENDGSPENWREIIDDLHIQWVESPLHDKDVNATGEPKKPHYHIMLMFSGVKSYEQVLEICQTLNCPIPQVVQSVKGMLRYMAHLDNPEKAQYNISDIVSHGGVDIDDILRPTASERYALMNEMRDFIKTYNILEYQDIYDFAAIHRFNDWFPLLNDHCTFVITTYIRSQRNRLKRGGSQALIEPDAVPAQEDQEEEFDE